MTADDVSGGALVTGAASETGWETCKRLEEDGWKVVATDASTGEYPRFIRWDLGVLERLEALVDEAEERVGPIRMLVNLAACYRIKSLETLSIADWEESLRINLVAPALLARTVATRLRSQNLDGAIVSISSTDAFQAGEDCAAYDASKAGLEALTRSLAAEFGPIGVRANAIAPGWIGTAVTEGRLSAEQRQRILEEIPNRKLIAPSEIANAVAFLASDAAHAINGHVLVADGGQTIRQTSVPRRETY